MLRWVGRPGWLLVVVGLMLGVLGPVSPVSADAFGDDDGGFYESAFDALAERGILDGTECGEGLVCPDEEMERWVMAVWLVRVLDDAEPAGVPSSRFVDVDAGEWWMPYVERLAELEVTKGCAVDPATFCPEASVTRAQMATFLTRAFGLESVSPAGFVDIQGSTHETNIDALAAARITRGCATARFCPKDTVIRGQMATFLARALGLISLPPVVGKTLTLSEIRALQLDPAPATVYMGIYPCCADFAFWQIPIEKGWFKELNITITPNSPTYHYFTASQEIIPWLHRGDGDIAAAWIPSLFGNLDTFGQTLPSILFQDIYVGYMILVAPDSDAKTTQELMVEGLSFAEAAQTAVQQLVGNHIHIPPHSTAQSQYADAFFAYLPQWWANAGNPRWAYLTDDEGLPHVVMNRDGTPAREAYGNPLPIRITTNDWRYYATPVFVADSTILQLSDTPGGIEFAMPFGALTLVQMIRDGWDPLINFAMMFEYDPVSLQAAIASATVGGTGLLARREWVEKNKDLAYRILSIAYRTFAFLEDPMTRYEGWTIEANIINERRLLSMEPEDIEIILNTIDPLFTWEEQEALWDLSLPSYHPETAFKVEIDKLQANGTLSWALDTEGAVEELLLARDLYYEMKQMQKRCEQLFDEAGDAELSSVQVALVEQARIFYDRYNFYDSLRHLEAALNR